MGELCSLEVCFLNVVIREYYVGSEVFTLLRRTFIEQRKALKNI
jgi:hypothetical protein